MIPVIVLFLYPLLGPSIGFKTWRRSPQRTMTRFYASKLGFLSFDLDDTLFATRPVVDDANRMMIEAMSRRGCNTTVEDFLQTTRRVRLQSEGPLSYTDLRKRAIEVEMNRFWATEDGSPLENLQSTPSSVVNELFEIWLAERHAAAERHLFANAIPVLKELKELYSDVCIAAITNGRGNPLEMPNTLQPFFDFCVSGEDEGIFPNRKPHPGIYEAALLRYNRMYSHHAQDHERRVWCHVGDCLVNDVGASASCGAYAVWYCPPQGDEDVSCTAPTAINNGRQGFWSTATPREINDRQEAAGTAIEKVAVKISSLSELPGAILAFLESTNEKQPYQDQL